MQTLGDTTSTCQQLDVLPTDYISELKIRYTTAETGGVIYMKYSTKNGTFIESGNSIAAGTDFTWTFNDTFPLIGLFGR